MDGFGETAENKLQYEAELRFLVADRRELIRRLSLANALHTEKFEIADNWFVPAGINSHSEHEEWLSSGKASPVRIRTLMHADQALSFIEVKRPVLTNNFDIAKEVSVRVDDCHAAERVLEAIGLRSLAVLTKTRNTYQIDQLWTCHLDTYTSGECILELESMLLELKEKEKIIPALLEASDALVSAISVRLKTSSAVYLINKYLLNSDHGPGAG
jgi:predicted adenylyl cyclase CyaB